MKNLQKLSYRKNASTKMSPIDVEQKHVKKLVQLVFPNVIKTYKTKRRNNGVRSSRRRNKIKLGDSVHISPRTDIPS